MSGIVGTAIQWAKIRRQVSPSSWIQDRIALKKMVQLCSACLYRMPHHWLRHAQYHEFHVAHGEGTCDGCRHEDVLSMFVSMEDPWFQQCERQAQQAASIRKADQDVLVNDRRRMRA